MRETETGLFELLETLLRAADHPMTCVEMYDMQTVREHATSANRVSDYLGGLWRKGKVSRSPAARNTNDSSRWAYSWRNKALGIESPTDTPAYSSRKTLLSKPNILITDDGNTITIDLPNLTISIKSK